MSTLNVVEEVLREKRTPMVVREIVEAAGGRLPTKSKTPDTVVARDLAMDIKRRGGDSKFCRIAPGRYTLRELAAGISMPAVMAQGSTPVYESTASSSVAQVSASPNGAHVVREP